MEISVTVAAVVKKILSILVSNEKGRKLIGYAIGIALFIVLLPVIAVYGLFGWLSGGGTAELITPDMVYGNLPTEYREQIEQYNTELSQIEITFTDNGLTETDISKGKTIYLSCLTGKEVEEGFYQTYAECFLDRSEESDLLQNISSAFGVSFSDADRQKLINIYGGL